MASQRREVLYSEFILIKVLFDYLLSQEFFMWKIWKQGTTQSETRSSVYMNGSHSLSSSYRFYPNYTQHTDEEQKDGLGSAIR